MTIAMELTSVYTALYNTASLERVIFDFSVFYFYMTPWYTFVLLLGTNLDRMEQVMSGGFEKMRRRGVFVEANDRDEKEACITIELSNALLKSRRNA